MIIIIVTICFAGFFNGNNKPTVSDDDVYYYDDDSSNDKYYENNDYYYDNLEDDTSTDDTVSSSHTNKETETTNKQETTTRKETTTPKETTTKKETTTVEFKDTYLALYKEENVLNEEEDEDFWGVVTYNKTLTSNTNATMEHSIYWYNNNNVVASSSVIYNLEGKYDVVTGTYFLWQDDKDTDLPGYFEIYGDGKRLYTSEYIEAGVLPKDFSVNIKGVQKLTVVLYGVGTGGFLGHGAHYGISNFIAEMN